MRERNVRYSIIDVTRHGRGRQFPRPLPVTADPLIARLLKILAERPLNFPQAEAPPPYTGTELEFEIPDRLAWPWQR